MHRESPRPTPLVLTSMFVFFWCWFCVVPASSFARVPLTRLGVQIGRPKTIGTTFDILHKYISASPGLIRADFEHISYRFGAVPALSLSQLYLRLVYRVLLGPHPPGGSLGRVPTAVFLRSRGCKGRFVPASGG